MLPGMQRALLHLDELEERPTAETAVQRTVTANAPAADYRRGEGSSMVNPRKLWPQWTTSW